MAATPQRRAPGSIGALREGFNAALARKKALQLRILNADYDSIAEKTGIRRGKVGNELARALAEIPMHEVVEYRKISVARLDTLARAFWPRALKGDIKAAQVILKIEERRADLLGLDQARRDGPSLGEAARALPPGAKLTVENVSPIWMDPTVMGAVQLAVRAKRIDPPGADVIDASFRSTPDTIAAEIAEDEDDPDAKLYAEVAALAAAGEGAGLRAASG